ncbi:MAG: 4-hydroxy-tetrahydrodipicolinate reductase [Planctomycetota bacterium]
MIKLAINGAAGRMGARLIDLASSNDQFEIVAAVEPQSHPKSGSDAGQLAGIGDLGIQIGPAFSDETQVVIDFSTPEGADRAIDYCDQKGIGLVMATTGLKPETTAAIESAAANIPIVFAPSMSLAVNLSMKLVEMAGTALKDHSSGVDVEIIERHHRFKVDSPSGTALRFGQIVAEAMGQTNHQHGREGLIGQRPANEIGYHAVRAGDNPGEHTILFGMLGETIELKVAASNRDCYAAGALAAAAFVANTKPGLYSMYDVLGF